MAITLTGTGPVDATKSPNPNKSSVGAYSFCSPVLATTANYADNVLSFGVSLNEIHIVNLGGNPLAFRLASLSAGDSGIVPANSSVTIRNVYQKGLSVRSADLALPTTCVVWGI